MFYQLNLFNIGKKQAALIVQLFIVNGFGYCNNRESLEVNLLKTNKYFTSKILLILELTFPSKLSEKRIQKPQNHAFLTLTISYCFFVNIWISKNVETSICLQLISRKYFKKMFKVKSSSNVRMKMKHTVTCNNCFLQLLTPKSILNFSFKFLGFI